MDRRGVIELLILGLWLTIAILVYVRERNPVLVVPIELVAPIVPEAKKGKRYDIRKIVALRGDTFDVTVRDLDNSRIVVKLTVTAVDDAKSKVLDLLNDSSDPKVVLREKQPDGRWVVDFFFSYMGHEDVNLAEWLVTNKLVYK